MSIRAPLCLALGLACAATGCVTTRGLRPMGPDGEVVHKADTYVKAGDWRAGSAFSPEYPEEQKAEFRQQSRMAYQKAIAADPRHLPAYVGLARLESRCGDLAAAEAAYQKAMTLAGQNAGLWSELAQAQLRQKKYAEAAVSLRKAVDLDPVNKEYTTRLGFTLVLAGKGNDAVTMLTRIHGEAKACVEVARAFRRLGQGEEASSLLARAEQINPELPELRRLRQEWSEAVPASHAAPAAPMTQPEAGQSRPAPMPRIETPAAAVPSPGEPGTASSEGPASPVFQISSRQK